MWLAPTDVQQRRNCALVSRATLSTETVFLRGCVTKNQESKIKFFRKSLIKRLLRPRPEFRARFTEGIFCILSLMCRGWLEEEKQLNTK